jgi:predicted RNA binding protein YcfA (HicA-like mRNA interferase family)
MANRGIPCMTKVLSSREIIRKLEADGWVLDHVSGSHHIFRHQTKRGPVVVPHPRKTLKRGTQRAILKQAGLLA